MTNNLFSLYMLVGFLAMLLIFYAFSKREKYLMKNREAGHPELLHLWKDPFVRVYVASGLLLVIGMFVTFLIYV